MKSTRIVLPIIAVGVLVLVTAVVVRHSRTSSPEQPPTEAILANAQGQSDRGPVRMIRFVLWDNAIYPRSMRVDKGLINVALEDKTYASEGLAFERVVGGTHERVVTVRRLQDHWRGRELVRLTPGQYVVYDVSKPNNKADLLVEP